MRIVGAILAGGRSSRMGTDKAGVVVDGRPMLETARAVLSQVCDDVVVVGGVHGDVVDDGLGPLGGLVAVLNAVRADRFVVVAVDQPRLTPSVLRGLLSHPAGADDGVSYRRHPLPVVVGAGALPRLQVALDAGERRMRAATTISVDVDDAVADAFADALVNVNTPDDVASLAPTTGDG